MSIKETSTEGLALSQTSKGDWELTTETLMAEDVLSRGAEGVDGYLTSVTQFLTPPPVSLQGDVSVGSQAVEGRELRSGQLSTTVSKYKAESRDAKPQSMRVDLSRMQTRVPKGVCTQGRKRGGKKGASRGDWSRNSPQSVLPRVSWQKKKKRTTTMRQPKDTRRKEVESLKWGVKRQRNTSRKNPGLEHLIRIQQRVDADGSGSELETASVAEGLGSRTLHLRQSVRNRKCLLESLTEDSDEEESPRKADRKVSAVVLADKAISKSGYTCRGRVKQKAQKQVDLLRLGERVVSDKWYNAGCIFPLGYKSRTKFRSSVDLDDFCIHECEIVRGIYWPNPTFVITAHDRPDEQLVASSCTGVWTLVLNRRNNEIIRRRKEGENRPPPPKTAIAGPEYFGLSHHDILRKIEALDRDKQCTTYWAGKQDRQIAARNLHLLPSYRTESNGRQIRSSNRRREPVSEEEDEVARDGGEEDDVCYTMSKWSALCRFDRYKKRCMNRGSLPDSAADDDNPLPDLIDLITMEPVVTPAISPYGHVIGLATWKAWLSEHRACPFTRNPLSIDHITILTKNNIDRYRDKIANF